jgi:glucose-1-phosphate cytidylyltransferase
MQHTTPVVILCGGLGTRLREETEYRPKPMVEIGGRPILWHIMKTYAAAGFTDFVLCLGYKGEVIKEYFLNYEAMHNDCTISLGQPASIEYHSRHQEQQWRVTLADTGAQTLTGARIKRVARYLTGDRFCLTYGDGVADVDPQALMAAHLQAGLVGTVTGVRPSARFGELVADGDRVVAFHEKPQSMEGLVNGGFFVFERRFLDYLSDDPGCILERAPLEGLVRDGQLHVYRHAGFWQCMDTIRDHQYLNEMWTAGRAPWRVWS